MNDEFVKETCTVREYDMINYFEFRAKTASINKQPNAIYTVQVTKKNSFSCPFFYSILFIMLLSYRRISGDLNLKKKELDTSFESIFVESIFFFNGFLIK